MKKDEDVSRKMTITTKPDPTDTKVYAPCEEKECGRAAPSTKEYTLLKSLMDQRDQLEIVIRRSEKELSEVEDAISTIISEVRKKGISDKNYIVTGVTMAKKRHVDAQWFLEHEPEIFSLVAKVDGKTALQILSEHTPDGVQPFLREIGGETYDANAKITMSDLQKIVGNDGMDVYERMGGVKAVWSPTGKAYLMPVEDAKLLGRTSILELTDGGFA